MVRRTRVYVGGLRHDCQKRDLEKFLIGYGRIKEILLKNGFGFVEFDDYRDAEDAIFELNGKDLLGQRVTLYFAMESFRDNNGAKYRSRSKSSSRSYTKTRCRSRSHSPLYSISRSKTHSRSRSRSKSRHRSASKSPASEKSIVYLRTIAGSSNAPNQSQPRSSSRSNFQTHSCWRSHSPRHNNYRSKTYSWSRSRLHSTISRSLSKSRHRSAYKSSASEYFPTIAGSSNASIRSRSLSQSTSRDRSATESPASEISRSRNPDGINCGLLTIAGSSIVSSSESVSASKQQKTSDDAESDREKRAATEHSVKHDEKELAQLQKLSEDFKRLYESRTNTDCSLKVGDVLIPAHSAVLSARSEVFAALFSPNIFEDQKDVVDITGVNAVMLSDVLHYVYSGKICGLSTDTAAAMYCAADKFSLIELKDSCLDFLIHNLTIENVCDAAILAVNHSESELEKKVSSFMVDKFDEIEKRDQWSQLTKNAPLLAIKLLRSAFMHSKETIEKLHKSSESVSASNQQKTSGDAESDREKRAATEQSVKPDEKELAKLQKLSEDFKCLYESKTNTDCFLKVGDSLILAHRTVLSTRSEVFAAMFHHDSSEKQSGFVYITDVDAGILSDVLHYVYSGKICGLSTDTAAAMYNVADKYALIELRDSCLDFLIHSLTIGNIFAAAILVVNHRECPELEKKIASFMVDKFDEIEKREEWSQIKSYKPSVAITLLRSALMLTKETIEKLHCNDPLLL